MHGANVRLEHVLGAEEVAGAAIDAAAEGSKCHRERLRFEGQAAAAAGFRREQKVSHVGVRVSIRVLPVDRVNTVEAVECRLELAKLSRDRRRTARSPKSSEVYRSCSYGGPNTVTIVDEAKYEFGHYLTTGRGVIYARIDARGSAFKGSRMLYGIYRRIGTAEVADTIAVTA